MNQSKQELAKKRYVCVHGHFYQPPRENPWLEEIEIQSSAHPYRDWNTRIAVECYAPNASSRILDAQGNIIDIVNNYESMSFNFGPTLLSWLEKFQPSIYESILEADRKGQRRYGGHGGAISQVYSHLIMPLANERDKRTQVLWGIRDFENRFKRKPEGMWLPETAVDLSSLEILAEQGILFTILGPFQAKRVRPLGGREWQDVVSGRIDTQIPYLCHLPSGKNIIIFFYEGGISHDVAFAGLLNSGEMFALRLLSAFHPDSKELRLVHIASDGETFGHHHKFGEMALSYCLHQIASQQVAQIGIYAHFLEKNPPRHEVEIVERSSWSCAHGVERWRSDCGCRIGSNPGWNQAWRIPLRLAMDWLRDQLRAIFEKELLPLCDSPWRMRDDYVYVLLDRSEDNINGYLNRYAKKNLTAQEKIKILKLLEMQRHAMYMFTSCGWFFDDISGIETLQIIQYAARAIQLAREVCGVDLETEYVQLLEKAKSNVILYKDGATIYRKLVKPLVIDLLNVGAHYAISALFEDVEQESSLYCYKASLQDFQKLESGRQKIVIGQVRIKSDITWEERLIDFAAFYFGDYNLSGGVRYHKDSDQYAGMTNQLKDMFGHNDASEIIQLMKTHFGTIYTLKDLFKNEQGKVLDRVFNHSLDSIEAHFREIYEHYYPLMQVNSDFSVPLPKALSMTVEFVLTREIIDVLEADELDVELLMKLAQEMKRWSFVRDRDALNAKASDRITQLMREFNQDVSQRDLLAGIIKALGIFEDLSLHIELREAQNIYFSVLKEKMAAIKADAERGQKDARDWLELFQKLGRIVKVKCVV